MLRASGISSITDSLLGSNNFMKSRDEEGLVMDLELSSPELSFLYKEIHCTLKWPNFILLAAMPTVWAIK